MEVFVYKEEGGITLDNQLDTNMINTLLNCGKHELVQNGRVSLDKLFEVLKEQEGGHALNFSDFQSIFGTQKSMKVSDLSSILRKYELNTFDIKNEMMSLFFEDNKFSFDKLAKTMKSLGYQELNKKNREMANECFDFNFNNVVDESDIEHLLEIINEYNLEQENAKDIRESGKSKKSNH